MFAILLPITFPTARSVFPFAAEKRLTVSSGAEVPKATIVRPITISETLSFFAIDAEPSQGG